MAERSKKNIKDHRCLTNARVISNKDVVHLREEIEAKVHAKQKKAKKPNKRKKKAASPPLSKISDADEWEDVADECESEIEQCASEPESFISDIIVVGGGM
jgi:hypothetical protein